MAAAGRRGKSKEERQAEVGFGRYPLYSFVGSKNSSSQCPPHTMKAWAPPVCHVMVRMVELLSVEDVGSCHLFAH